LHAGGDVDDGPGQLVRLFGEQRGRTEQLHESFGDQRREAGHHLVGDMALDHLVQIVMVVRVRFGHLGTVVVQRRQHLVVGVHGLVAADGHRARVDDVRLHVHVPVERECRGERHVRQRDVEMAGLRLVRVGRHVDAVHLGRLQRHADGELRTETAKYNCRRRRLRPSRVV